MRDSQQNDQQEQLIPAKETNEHTERRSSGKRYFGRGGVKIALLKLLESESMHGYQMMKALEEQSGGLYAPSAGTIYPTLQMLEERGFVSIMEDSGKKVYSITEHGLSALTLLPDKPKSDLDRKDGFCAEVESFRNEKIRRKLGLSNESFDLLMLVTRAEREASASQEQKTRLTKLLNDQQEQINHFLAQNQSSKAGKDDKGGIN